MNILTKGIRTIMTKWTLILLSLLYACNNERKDPEIETITMENNVWQLIEESGKDQNRSFPVSVQGDFDNDGTEETILRNDYYVFEGGWAFRAYSYTVIEDKGSDVTTLQNRTGQLFTGAASPYKKNEKSISIFLKDYILTINDNKLIFQSSDNRLIFMKSKIITINEVKNAPLEPENNGDLAGKTWRMKYETGFEAKPDIFYPVEKISDFDKDGTDETLERDDFYVFTIPWCYSAYIKTILNDPGPDTQSLQQDNGLLSQKHLNYFMFNDARDSIYFNGNAYAYSNDGKNMILRRGKYKALLEYEPDIDADKVIALYEEDDDIW